jgi:hypothetical protein
LEVYKAKVTLIFKKLNNKYLFMQDNAFIYRANTVKAQFAAYGITQIKNWLTYSLNLNPIEHI